MHQTPCTTHHRFWRPCTAQTTLGVGPWAPPVGVRVPGLQWQIVPRCTALLPLSQQAVLRSPPAEHGQKCWMLGSLMQQLRPQARPSLEGRGMGIVSVSAASSVLRAIYFCVYLVRFG